MKPREDPETASWLSKAQDDLAIADLVLSSGRDLHWAVCFHCQQAAEKALEALLVALGASPPRSHDLTELAALTGGAVSGIEDAAEELTDYAVLPRYPVPGLGSSPAAASRAVRMAKHVLSAVDGALSTGRGSDG